MDCGVPHLANTDFIFDLGKELAGQYPSTTNNPNCSLKAATKDIWPDGANEPPYIDGAVEEETEKQPFVNNKKGEAAEPLKSLLASIDRYTSNGPNEPKPPRTEQKIVDSLGQLNLDNQRERPCVSVGVTFGYFEALVTDMKLYVFSLLDIYSLTVCRRVSRTFKKNVGALIFYRQHALMKVCLCRFWTRKAKKLTSKLEEKLEARVQLGFEFLFETQSTKELANQKARIGYLKSTLQAIEDLFKLERLCNINSDLYKCGRAVVQSFERLVHVLCVSIDETHTALDEISKGEMEVTPNFDIFELALRRYYDQLKRMFVDAGTSALRTPSSIIVDERAKQLWDELFGQGQYFVKFDRFCKDVILPLMSSRSREQDSYEDLIKSLKFFVNFPRDDLVTPYKFHLLCCHWGPYDKIVCNLEKYALCNGFVGLVNAIQSKQMLLHARGVKNNKAAARKTFVLMRFSRLHPDKLTISYISPSREVRHYRKPVDMSVEEMLSIKRGLVSGEIEFIDRRLDWLTIERKTTLHAFAAYRGHYL